MASILRPCAADCRQHHALAAPVFKAATRFAAWIEPVRLASSTADERLHDADASSFNPSGGIRSRVGVELPVLQRGEPHVPCIASTSTLPSAAQARAEAISYLALAYTGKRLPLQVRHSAAGHYIGTFDKDGPASRGPSSTSARSTRPTTPSQKAAGSNASTPDFHLPGAIS